MTRRCTPLSYAWPFYVCGVLFATACGGSTKSTPAREATSHQLSPPNLLPVDRLEKELFMRQRVTIAWRKRESAFDAVLQKTPGQLRLLGLGPMNSVGFVIEHTEHGVRLDNRTGRRLPFHPARIVVDVQRVFYPWLEEKNECKTPKRRKVVAEVAVEELCRNGHLAERRFWLDAKALAAPEGGEPKGPDVVVRYDFSQEVPSANLKRVTLKHLRFGYTLKITPQY